MKYFKENSTEEFTYEDLDFDKGYIEYKEQTIHHDEVPFIEEQGHYETITEYPNGGKDVEWVIDIPGQQHIEAYDEVIKYGLYKEYTEDEYAEKMYEKEISEYKYKLNATDYLAIKYAEGLISEKDYKETKELRQSYRDKINNNEEKIKKIKKEKKNKE